MSDLRARNKAWITGLIGVIAIHVLAYAYGWLEVAKNGWIFFGKQHTNSVPQSILVVLVVVGFSMFATELILRFYFEGKGAIRVDETLRRRKYGQFIWQYLLSLSGYVFWLAVFWAFYRFSIEYGYGREGSTYENWFVIYDTTLRVMFWFLPIYTLATRIFQADEKLDAKEPFHLITFWLKPKTERKESPRQILLALFVKGFFIPLMTVFFIDQFSTMGKNWGYLLNHLDTKAMDYTYMTSLKDIYNISFTAIFTVDVGLAWAGYVFASRWIKNTMQSTEPTFLGWAVTLFCYPPFNAILFYYFSIPSDKDFLKIPNIPFITVLVILSLISYVIYAGSTVFFGLRFSNLTHRGIITTGFYKFVRHPAYVGKNISWWLVMLPYIVYEAVAQQSFIPLFQIVGLVMMTTLYYWRAITEERHLFHDPEYVEYCQKVKYRFIPGVI